MNPQPIRDLDQLTQLFRRSEKPRTEWRIGLEAEKFGVDRRTGQPLSYLGERGVSGIYEWLSQEFDWQPQRETENGPLIALRRQASSLTLEPGGQVELSGSPLPTVHQVAAEFETHIAELAAVTERFDVSFIHTGFHPTATLEELPWVPKRRYPIMRRYLPSQGRRALDMMQRTATVQVNLDYASERDALDKMLILLRLTPLLQAMTVNAPFIEGRRSERLSERQDVWLHMDPRRSGLLLALWDKPEATYSDYVDWALDAGMFLFVRDGAIVENTGQTFREFITHGFQGHQATEADWQLHLGTLFPEVRLKSTLEIRCCDSLPPRLALAVPALLTGITYDEGSLDQARELAARIASEDVVALQRDVSLSGVRASYRGEPIAASCMSLLEIAKRGLEARAAYDDTGRDESRYLDPLLALVDAGLSPADDALTRVGHFERLAVSDLERLQ